ncbi:MAG TPA: hypothetical protein PK771_00020 [Spirochaetota bacterium]|nr:hypothetical protein [Spirochaetota bacterium]
MSIIYNEYIKECLNNIEDCNNKTDFTCSKNSLCSSQCEFKNNCVDCLSKIFNDTAHKMRVYECLNITISYVARFLNRYASEIYYLLVNKKKLWGDIDNKNIISLGCGPATELIGIEKILRERSESIKCNYIGFDQNDIWNFCQTTISNIIKQKSKFILPYFYNSTLKYDNKYLSSTKLFILNYIISDIYKHSDNSSIEVSNFLNDIITPIINSLPLNSYILINDTNSYNMGRDEIEKWVNSLSISQYKNKKGVFDYTGRNCNMIFSYPCKIAPVNKFIFQNISNINDFTNNVNECRSACILIEKIGV